MLKHQIVRVNDSDPSDVTVLLEADLLDAVVAESESRSWWIRRKKNRAHVIDAHQAAVAALKEQTVRLP